MCEREVYHQVSITVRKIGFENKEIQEMYEVDFL